jgi:hypothetical protein
MARGSLYPNQPVVVTFKTSNRANAQVKQKVYNNRNIDDVLEADKLTGIPPRAVITHIGVGKSFIGKNI